MPIAYLRKCTDKLGVCIHEYFVYIPAMTRVNSAGR